MSDGPVLDEGTEQRLDMNDDEWEQLSDGCPHCGGESQEFTKRVWPEGEMLPGATDYSVHCDGCCAEGPIASTKKIAIERYNGNFDQTKDA